MLKNFFIVFLAAVFMVVIPQYAMAFELVEDQGKPRTIGLGYELSMDYQPVVTIAYNFNNNLEAQGIIGISSSGYTMDFYSLNFLYGGKVIYRLFGKPAKDLYIFGLLGGFSRDTATTIGGGAGVGLETSYMNIPNIACFGELGYSVFGFRDTSMLLLNYGFRLYF